MRASYKLLAAGTLPGGVKYYLWDREGWLYLTVKRGVVRKTVYLGKADSSEPAEGEAEDECRKLLRELAEAYKEAVDLARRAAREAQTREELREALKEIAYPPRALEEALEFLGYGKEV